LGRACYHNSRNASEYSSLGHAEAVELTIPAMAIAAAASIFFNSFVTYGGNIWEREDYFDLGPGYRAIIGLPGGITSPLFPDVAAMNVNGMQLKSGYGNESDTLGKNLVYVMDSTTFEFHQASYHRSNNPTGVGSRLSRL